MRLYKKGDEYLRIQTDEDPMSPREGDNLGVIATWHSRYNLGDIRPGESLKTYIEALPVGTVLLPVYLYDHSAISLRTEPFDCPWDSGQVGFIYATPAQVEALGVPIDQVEEQLRSEIAVYNSYINGDIYGYTLFKKEYCSACGAEEEIEVSSCWDYYGDDFVRNGLFEDAGVESIDEWEELS